MGQGQVVQRFKDQVRRQNAQPRFQELARSLAGIGEEAGKDDEAGHVEDVHVPRDVQVVRGEPGQVEKDH